MDELFIDEAHFFKNLETPTKMERVAGLQTGGSERAFDLYMKVRRESRLFDCLAWLRNLDQTCGSVRSSLSTPAPPATAEWEAVETTYPDPSGLERHREVSSILPAPRREKGQAWWHDQQM